MSETGNLKLKKHDNPETNTEKFDIGNYLNGNWDKIDENAKKVNTDISNINSKNTELEKELKEMQEDFYQNSIRGQASGEYIHVEDSSNCRAKIGIGGNSRQETRSGKNKLNSASIGVGTNNGITCTYDSKTGIITFNGACNTDNTRFTFENTSIPFTNNLTKTLAYYVSGSITTYCLFRTFDSEWSAGETLNLLDLSSSKNKTRIISSNTTIKTNIDIRFNNGSVANNFQIKLMITDSENDDYEQYGASPSPDYPSEVESCGDNGNLFDKNDITNNTSIDVRNGNTYKDNNSFSTNFIKINGITELCCNGLSDTSKLWGAIYDENKSYIKGINTTNGIFNETNLSGATYIRLGLLKTYLDTMKLEKGKVATPYTPYGQGCINEVICNRNLFNTDVEQGSVSTDTGEKTSSEYSIRTEFIKVTPNKEYILKYSTDLTSDYNTKIVEFDKNKAFLKTTVALPPNKKLSITTNNQTEYVIIAIYSGTKLSPLTYTNYFKNIEFKQNDGSEYIEHKSQTYTIPTQQPMRSIGDIRDTFIKKNNKWYEHHPVIRKIFDGSENFTATTGWGNTTYQIIINGMASPNSNSIMGKALCSHFTIKSGSDMYYNASENAFAICSGNILRIRNIDITTLEDFKAWLQHQYNAGTPVYVDYVLETPLDIECTEEQSSVLEELSNARTYKNVTNIYSTDEISPILDLDYAKDLEILLNNTQALAVNNASEGV